MGKRLFDVIWFGLVFLSVTFVIFMGVNFANAEVESNNYLIYKYGNTTNALNSFTGVVDFSGNDAGQVISNAAAASYPNPGSVLVKCGNYNLYSQIQLWKSSSL